MTTLVTGATGLIGRSTVAQLSAAGEAVRALTRHPDTAHFPEAVEVVEGDLNAPDSLVPALTGVERVFLLAVPETVEAVVQRARAVGVQRIVVLSASAVTYNMDQNFHLPVEQAVERSGLEWTHLRPGEFAANKLALWGPSIRAERVVRYPNPDRPQFTPLHEADIAAMATVALLQDGHQGRAYTFTGPGYRSLREQVSDIASAIGEPVRYEEVSRDTAWQLLRAQGGQAAVVGEVMLGLKVLYKPSTGGEAFDWSRSGPAAEVIEEVTGHPARSFATWAQAHVEDFL